MKDMKFVDTDELFKEHTCDTPAVYVEKHGREEFLKEQDFIILSTSFEDSVVATGGSVSTSNSAMEHLRENGIVVFLDISIDILKKRLDGKRLLARDNGTSIEELYGNRLPYYRKYADYIILQDNFTEMETAEKVVEFIENYNEATNISPSS